LNGSAPSEKEISAILSSVGVESDKDRVKQLLSALEGKDLAEVI
jgi:ribosomal protein L12E/L44/L45/RPP1/RPP2